MSNEARVKTRRHSAVDEVTPLLAASGSGVTVNAGPAEEAVIEGSHANGTDGDDKPLPMRQIFLLCYARVVEPIAFFSIFPFINQMIYESGNLEEADVGFYSGLIESLFSLTQMSLMIPWGWAADYYGRRPILILSLIGVSVSVALFGLSQKIWQMILFRCLAGVFAGTIVTIRAMLSEHSTPRTQARAFSLFGFAGNVGIFIGPLIGGALSKPATQYPGVFGNVRFFHEYPYALATIVTGAVGASAALVSFLFVHETLPADARAAAKANKDPAAHSTWTMLKSEGVPVVLFIYGWTMLIALAYTAVAPVFWFSKVALGGFGFTPLQISVFLALAGFSQAVWLLFVFPPLQLRLGTGNVLRACFAVYPFVFLFGPACNTLLRHNLTTPFWIVAVISSIVGSDVSMSFTAVQLALNDVAPSPAMLGTLNAVALTLVSGIRAFAPALFASLFAAGARTQLLGGYVVWIVLVGLTLVNLVALRWYPARAEGRVKKRALEE